MKLPDEVQAIFFLNKLPTVMHAKRQINKVEPERFLLVATLKGKIFIVDIVKLEICMEWQSLNKSIRCSAFSQEQTILVTCFQNCAEMLFPITGTQKMCIENDCEITACMFVDRWSCFVTADEMGYIKLWSIPYFHLLASVRVKTVSTGLGLQHLQCSTVSNCIVTGDDNTVYVMSVEYINNAIFNSIDKSSIQKSHGKTMFDKTNYLATIFENKYILDNAYYEKVLTEDAINIVPGFDTEKQVKVNFMFVSHRDQFEKYIQTLHDLGPTPYIASCSETLYDLGSAVYQPFALVLDSGKCSLREFMDNHTILTKREVRWIVECLAKGIQHLHQAGFSCGCLTPERIHLVERWDPVEMQTYSYWKIISPETIIPLNSSIRVDKYCAKKSDLYYCPPELAPKISIEEPSDEYKRQTISNLEELLEENNFEVDSVAFQDEEHMVRVLSDEITQANTSYDIWVFAVILAELLSRRSMFEGMTTRETVAVLKDEKYNFLKPLVQRPSFTNDISLRTVLQNVLVRDSTRRWTMNKIVDHLEGTGCLIGKRIDTNRNVQGLRKFPSPKKNEVFETLKFTLHGTEGLQLAQFKIQTREVNCILLLDNPLVVLCSYYLGDEAKLAMYTLNGGYLGVLPSKPDEGARRTRRRKMTAPKLEPANIVKNTDDDDRKKKKAKKHNPTPLEVLMSQHEEEERMKTPELKQETLSTENGNTYVDEETQNGDIDNDEKNSIHKYTDNYSNYDWRWPNVEVDIGQRQADVDDEVSKINGYQEGYGKYDFNNICPFFSNLQKNGVEITPIKPFCMFLNFNLQL